MFPVAFWLGRRRPLCRVPVVAVAVCHVSASQVRPSDAERDRSICRVQVRRRPPGRRDLVATGWLSPSYSEGDTLVVAIRLFWLLFCFAGPVVAGARYRTGCGGGCGAALLSAAVRASVDRFTLVSAVAVLPQSLRCAVGLAGFFPERCLGGSGGGSPRTSLCYFCSFAYCSVLSDGSCCLVVWVVHFGEGSSQDRPLSLLVEVLPRSALCLFWATVVLPLWFEVCRLVGLRSGEVLPGWLLALLVEVLPKAASCCCGVKATCQVSRSPEAPARATRGLAPVGLSECSDFSCRAVCAGVGRRPLRGFLKGCRVCPCLLGLSWLQVSCAVFVVIAPPILFSP
ncbi:hypothetical protein Taro_052619, partial [Colocasia esculenta]|nr:hypothetical protein [Colocasia esculenta]